MEGVSRNKEGDIVLKNYSFSHCMEHAIEYYLKIDDITITDNQKDYISKRHQDFRLVLCTIKDWNTQKLKDLQEILKGWIKK